MGMNDVKAVVSFHGGLGSLPPVSVNVEPKVLVLSGGADDTSTEIMDLEMTLDMANATWEITRYSDIEHAFTVFGDDRYNKWVRALLSEASIPDYLFVQLLTLFIIRLMNNHGVV